MSFYVTLPEIVMFARRVSARIPIHLLFSVV